MLNGIAIGIKLLNLAHVLLALIMVMIWSTSSGLGRHQCVRLYCLLNWRLALVRRLLLFVARAWGATVNILWLDLKVFLSHSCFLLLVARSDWDTRSKAKYTLTAIPLVVLEGCEVGIKWIDNVAWLFEVFVDLFCVWTETFTLCRRCTGGWSIFKGWSVNHHLVIGAHVMESFYLFGYSALLDEAVVALRVESDTGTVAIWHLRSSWNVKEFIAHWRHTWLIKLWCSDSKISRFTLDLSLVKNGTIKRLVSAQHSTTLLVLARSLHSCV